MSTKQQRMRGSINGNGNGNRYAWNNHNQQNYHNNSNYHGNGFSTSGFSSVREDAEVRKFMDDGRDVQQMFKDLNDKMNDRYRRYSKIESDIVKRHEELKTQADALAEEKKLVAKWKAEAAASQAKAEKDLMEIKNEREQLERASTDMAVQLAELRRVQRELGKEPAISSRPLARQEADDDVPLAKRMKLMKKKDTNKCKVPIKIALQEDAPGLYEIMEEKGLVDEMDIIANVWDESEMEALQDEDFQELGAVISKVWARSTGLVKDTKHKVQSTSAHKPNYCLPCLSSLIEQTRLLKQKGWPVKWGWCRPLQSFIFVFQNHNRIVMERPEYGYATYFFEIGEGQKLKWQVERLIKVLSSVCNCRAALLENRPLQIGKELLPQEAEVMQRYGWTPDSGVSSLLNFCDRVLHDYKNEDESDWRAKIGKMLMDGLDQGRFTKVENSRVKSDDILPAIEASGGLTSDAVKMILACVKQEQP